MSAYQRYFSVGVLLVMTLVGAPLVARDLIRGSSEWWFDLFWLGVLLFFWFTALYRFAWRVDFDESQAVFRAVLRRVETSLARIRAIESKQSGVYSVRTDTAKVLVWGPLEGWFDFVQRVRAANPGVKMKGI